MLRLRLRSQMLLAALLAATLWPTPGAPQPPERFCLICGSLGGVDFVANVVLFLPLGAFLVLDGNGWRRAALAGAALSLGIELLQWQAIPGRDASMGDLLANSLGAGMGAALALHRRSLWAPPQALARSLTLATSAGAVVVALVASWALRPAVPDLVYSSQWTPVRGGYAPLAGTLRGVRLFGERLPNAVAVDPTNRPAPYARGEIDLTGELADPDISLTSPVLLFRLGNILGEQAQLVQRGSTLVFRPRLNAARAGFRSPSFVLDRAWGPAVATPFRVTSVRGTVRMMARTQREFRVTIGRAWQVLSVFEIHRAGADPWMAALLVVLLVAPPAFYARHARLPAGLPLGVALLVLVACPLGLGIAAGGTWEVAGGVLGLLGGRLLALQPGRRGA